jgi:hypothetical protein
MTLSTDLSGVTFTAAAKRAFAKSGADLPSLVNNALELTLQLQVILKTIIALHPTTGADASNSASLSAILAELA